MPSDVRKRSALPFRLFKNSGYAPANWADPKKVSDLPEGPKAFRTSSGIAADLLGKAADTQKLLKPKRFVGR